MKSSLSLATWHLTFSDAVLAKSAQVSSVEDQAPSVGGKQFGGGSSCTLLRIGVPKFCACNPAILLPSQILNYHYSSSSIGKRPASFEDKRPPRGGRKQKRLPVYEVSVWLVVYGRRSPVASVKLTFSLLRSTKEAKPTLAYVHIQSALISALCCWWPAAAVLIGYFVMQWRYYQNKEAEYRRRPRSRLLC